MTSGPDKVRGRPDQVGGAAVCGGRRGGRAGHREHAEHQAQAGERDAPSP